MAYRHQRVACSYQHVCVLQAESSRLKRELMNERQQVAELQVATRTANATRQQVEDELRRLQQRSEQELVQVTLVPC